jgi:hypothetical protein
METGYDLIIAGFLDSVRHPELLITRKQYVSETQSVTFFKWGQGDPYSEEWRLLGCYAVWLL